MRAPVTSRIVLVPLRAPLPVGISPRKSIVKFVLPASKVVLLVRVPPRPRHRVSHAVRQQNIREEVETVSPGHSRRSPITTRHEDVWAFPSEEVLPTAPGAIT